MVTAIILAVLGAAIAAGLIRGARIIRESKVPINVESTVKIDNTVQAVTIDSGSENVSTLQGTIAAFMKHNTNTSYYGTYSTHQLFCFQLFIEKLKEYFEVKTTYKSNVSGSSSEYYQFVLTKTNPDTEEKHSAVISVNSTLFTPEAFTNSQRFNNFFINKNETKVSGGKKVVKTTQFIECIISFIFVYPDPTHVNTDIKMEIIEEIMRVTSMKLVSKVKNNDPKFFTIMKDKGGYFVDVTKGGNWNLSLAEVKTNYPKCMITYQQEEKLVPGTATEFFIINALLKKHNVGLYGDGGSGKTRLAQDILYKVSQDSLVKVFFVNINTIQTILTDPEFSWKQIFGDPEEIKALKVKNILFIEEAERLMLEKSADFKRLTDSSETDLYNFVTFVVFNGEKKDFEKAVLRSGRITTIKIEYLTKPEAKAVALRLKEEASEEEADNKYNYDKALKFIENKKGEISLDEIYSFHYSSSDEEYENMIKNVFKELKEGTEEDVFATLT